MNTKENPSAVRVLRETGETRFAVDIGPRVSRKPSLPLFNRLLSHFLDHFSKASRLSLELVNTQWPGSWLLDHVLCEDMGQLIGRGVAAIHDQVARQQGLIGRSHAKVCMDDAMAEVVISFEARPRAEWIVPPNSNIDGFVDAWYAEDGHLLGWSSGTNLRQFLDGFAIGAGCGLVITIEHAGNLHHLYECIFRALGDAVGSALGLTMSVGALPGDTSGLAGMPAYSVERLEG